MSAAVDATHTIEKFFLEQGLATTFLLFIFWFLAMRVWPWFTEKAFPVVVEQNRVRVQQQADMLKNIIELRVISAQNSHNLEVLNEILRQFSMAFAGQRTLAPVVGQVVPPDVVTIDPDVFKSPMKPEPPAPPPKPSEEKKP